MKSFQKSKKEIDLLEHGRVIARGMEDVKVEKQKNMAKADKRRATMLENAADIALSGGVQYRRPK